MAVLERPVPVAAESSAVALPVPPAAARLGAAESFGSAASPLAEATKRATALTPAEKREAGRQAELYALFVATEHLESAFVRGCITTEDYERHIKQLLTQFQTLRSGLRDTYGDLKAWPRQHGLHCPLAVERLLGTGVAATALFGGGKNTDQAAGCFKASEALITLMDALKLEISAVDELLPMVRDLQASMVGIKDLPQLSGLDRISTWLVTLNNMRASDALDVAQRRQLSLDVETAYASMKQWLEKR